MAATLADPPSSQRLPSGPLAIPRFPPIQLFCPHWYSVMPPLGSMAPTLVDSLNHSRLSGPTLMSTGVLLVRYSVIAPAGVILATTFCLKSIARSVNQLFPSCHFTMRKGSLPDRTAKRVNLLE